MPPDGQPRKMIAQFVFLAAAVLILVWSVCSGVRLKNESQVLVREAELAVKIQPEFIVKDDPVCSAERVLEIPPHKGRGWKQEAGGLAEYNVTLDQGGPYWLWLRTYWRDGCQNAVYVQANNGRKIVVGNDAIFAQWHWVRSGSYDFHKGHNKLYLLNHSDGIAIDKWELTQSGDYQPTDYGSEVTDFFDGFGGCDGGNAGSWSIVSGNWEVTGDDQGNQNGMGAVFMQMDRGNALAVADQITVERFTASLLLQPGGSGEIGLALGRDKQAPQYLLLWEKSGKLNLSNTETGEQKQLGKSIRNTGSWSQWEVRYVNGNLQLSISGEPVIEPYPVAIRKGKLGLYTAGAPYSAFDNVRIRCMK